MTESSGRRPAPMWPRLDLAMLAVVCVVAAAVFLRLLSAPFLAWDDDRNISANVYYAHLGMWRLWREPSFGLYVPVISTVWGALLAIGGGSARVFRVFNVALHVVNIVLVWRLTVAALPRVLPAARDWAPTAAVVGATVFAVHPVQVGAVAWISGGRDLLATCLALIAVLVYFRGTRLSYALSTLAFAAALLSKPSVAAVPVAVVAFVAVFERERLKATCLAMAPWALAVGAVAVVTSRVQSNMAVVIVPLARRPVIALDAIGFYLEKLAWPVGLSIDYGRTPAWIGDRMGLALATIELALGAAALLGWLARRRRAYAVSVLWLVLLAPVLGLTPFAFQRISTVADHYQYVPTVGLAMLAAVALADVARSRWAVRAIGLCLLVVWATVSWQRTAVWRDSDALFADALEHNATSFVALSHLGQSACATGDAALGDQLMQRALRVRPADATGLAGAAYCLFHAQRYDDVVAMQVVLRDPSALESLEHDDVSASHFANIVAGALFQRNQTREGFLYLCQAQAVNPYADEIRQNVADVSRALAARGMGARCPTQRLPWTAFAALVLSPPQVARPPE